MSKNTDELLSRAHEIIENSEDVQSSLEHVRDIYNIHHIVFHLGQTSVSETDSPFVRTTYNPEWVSRYLLKGYVNVDPVVAEGFARQLPFDWREITPTPAAIQMMTDAAAYDIGSSGYSIPLVDKNSRRSLLSITSKLINGEWDEFITTKGDHFQEISFWYHRKALKELYGDLDPMPALGPREIECLTWTARGKDYQAIAIILGISGHTARGYLKSARFKLECATLAQAVAKAIRLKLIRD